MPLLDNSESTMQRNIKLQEASFGTVQADVNDHNKDTSAWAKLLKRERGEHENDGIKPNMQETETPMIV